MMIWKARHYKRLLILVVAGFVALAVLVLVARPSASSLFRRVVVSPIPQSVKKIRADRSGERSLGWKEHTYILRFEISKEDLLGIVASGRFTRIGYAEYSCWTDWGVLSYGLTPRVQGNFMLYEGRSKEPGWFDLAQWRDFEVYIVEEEYPVSWYKVRLLLYDERLGRAYFLEHEVSGRWGGKRSVTDARVGEVGEQDHWQIEQTDKERHDDANGSVNIRAD